MRAIPEELAARLAGGVTTLAHVWRVTRRDGLQFGFTDHDETLMLDGLACAPQSGLEAGAIEKSLGLAVDSASVAGALQHETITEDDLARGLWDGARVDLYRVDWTAPALKVHLFAGRIGEARRGAQAFEAELRGLQAPFNVPIGRVFARSCDADLGDARCGLDLATSAFTGEGAVVEILSARAFRASGLASYADGWFSKGSLVWALGGEAEISVHRAGAETHVLELVAPAGPALALGAAFAARAGCDKRFETCRAKFANTLNFRGHPHMPGNDAVQAGPAASGNDGGSRWR